jgi:hypothetical protein
MAQLTIEIPDALSSAIGGTDTERSRSALEALALMAYRDHKLSTAQLRTVLGFENGYELDGFLKAHHVWLDYSMDDLKRDRETHRQLGL